MELPSDVQRPATYTPVRLQNLFTIAEWQDELPWQYFREGVQIYRLYGDGQTGPSAVLIRYEKGTEVALHRHTGYEHIIVLSGSQSDQNGKASVGTLIINQPGTEHRIDSDSGCIVLVIYEKPVAFL